MPKAVINGVNIYYEASGDGFPIVWSHEFAGDYRSWEPQVRFFSRRYRVITYNARGYPPSDVPTSPDDYSQDQAVEDLRGLLDHLNIETAHLAGLSMGGSVVLNFGLKYPRRSTSLVVAGAGSGSDDPEDYRKRTEDIAQRMASGDMTAMSDFTRSPNRLPFIQKDKRGWQEFADLFVQHSLIGSALTFRGVQARRASIYSLEDRLRALGVPTLIMVGDEDDGCIKPSLFMKRCIPRSGLIVFPRSGHVINLEEPEMFNVAVLNFITAVESGKWARAEGSNIT
ncbi:MAG: alpha/beta fold hydrolase [Deltaproteobacteria bacterium]|nr:alpha/beta fold hydrolase [Deltaproteobacteria bacterium]